MGPVVSSHSLVTASLWNLLSLKKFCCKISLVESSLLSY